MINCILWTLYSIVSGLFLVYSLYEVRNKGSIGLIIRHGYNLYCFMYMPIIIFAGLFSIYSGVTEGIIFLLAPLSFYTGVIIINVLMNKEYKKSLMN